MSDRLKIHFSTLTRPEGGTLVVFTGEIAGEGLAFSTPVRDVLGSAAITAIGRAVASEKFKGKAKSTLMLLAPADLDVDRILLVGLGDTKAQAETDYVALGGAIMTKLGKANEATLLLEGPIDWRADADAAADIALGMRLRNYTFDRYKTKKKDDEEETTSTSVTIGVADPSAAKKAAKARDAIAEGINLARDLVNEPPNVLFPTEFADRAEALTKLGVEVEVLDEKQLHKLGMRALLAVGQGSERESRVVIMRWNGVKASKDKDAPGPLAFIGKGVCFDTGGISIKPAAGMEDMKGDMAGAACVVGLMHALAARKAKVNAIGVIGVVENMPGGNSYRPGDILTSMSGQTIEVINTDAEGRLVLSDVLWYVKERFAPSFMIDLATLTGAILVALGQEHAGLFSNNDDLSERLSAAGKVTGETVWRMPLGKAYDKMIDSRFADMKNTGGRFGGSITAAQFLQRFVGDTPWVHLDIAGTGMSSPTNDLNQSWGSGWGVRLLDRLVADYYEK